MGRLWRLLIRLLIHYQGQEPDIRLVNLISVGSIEFSPYTSKTDQRNKKYFFLFAICNKRIIISNISIKYIAIRTSRYRVFRLVKFMLIEAEIGAPTVGEVEIEERKI